MIDKDFERATKILRKPIKKRGMKVEYPSPKSNIEAEQWGNIKVGLIRQSNWLNNRIKETPRLRLAAESN